MPVGMALGYKELWQLRFKNSPEELKFILKEGSLKVHVCWLEKNVLRDFEQM